MYITNPFSKNSLSSLLFPRLQLPVQVSLSLFPVVWSGLHSCLLVLWFSGSGPLALWTTCSVPVPGWLASMCCSWIYLPSLGPLVSPVGGVVWCYPCWDPARFVLLQLSSLFICLLFILGLICCWCYSSQVTGQCCSKAVIGRDGKVQFGLVLQGILKNPEPDYQFGPLITVNLGPYHWFGPKQSGSGSQVVRTTNRT
jgi:hypothetical protein